MKLPARMLPLAIFLFTIAVSLSAQSPAVNWGPLSFLLGEWAGEGSSEARQGSGGTSFTLDLQKRIMVRKNRAEYPATKDRPAYIHDDLMVIYKESEESPFRAIFFDNEGHVIHYVVRFSADEKSFQFLSDALPTGPRFRLTYGKTGPSTMDITFEIAPPGKPDSFSPFIAGKLRRKG